MFGLFTHTVFEEESDVQVKIAQFQHPDVENSGSRFLIVGFLIVCLHRSTSRSKLRILCAPTMNPFPRIRPVAFQWPVGTLAGWLS